MSCVPQTNLQLFNRLLGLGWSEPELARVADAYDLAARLFSGQYRPSRKPFVDHLVGTAALVAENGGSSVLVAAAILHAAYPAGDFGDGSRRATQRKRRLLRQSVGEEVEAVVRDYARLAWDARAVDALVVRADTLGEREREVLLVRIANELEDHLDLGGRYGKVGDAERQKDELLERTVGLAERLGWDALAAGLRSAGSAEREAQVPPALRRPLGRSSLIPPLSLRPRLGVVLRRARLRLRRARKRRR